MTMWSKPLLTAFLSAWWMFCAWSVDCPGYTASDVEVTESTLVASLNLAGSPCGTYGVDLEKLILLVEYQTGELVRLKMVDG